MKVPVWLTKVGCKLKAASPEILVGVGIAAIIGGGVLACVNTAKNLADICDEIEDRKHEIAKAPEEDQKPLKGELVLFTIGSFAKQYGLPVMMVGLGITSICVGHGQLRKRYLVLSAAYNTLTQAYETYRKRIYEEYGEDADYYGRTGIKTNRYTDENGEEHVERIGGSEENIRATSPYFRVIDRDSILFKQEGGNKIGIRSRLEQYEAYLNECYFQGRPIYLNDIYKWIFGLQEHRLCDDGQILGWYLHDPVNRESIDIAPNDGRAIRLNIGTFPGKVGDDDPYDRDMDYICIDPRPAGVISLARGNDFRISRPVKRVGNRYSGVVHCEEVA